ncbi:hypothetical protein KFZ56_18550 [Virgibacillus sp. NKC19-3]|uniref:hypothetical protein n=1 Tax=Virgibacillus saliphilus TaxID=2831674 RepID=UPI001C9AF9DE|nr:hypothetical protein [Virgibacillus sp. NKC19-3]MBY7145021.1 hypothetical protein [Virgibacillus sp. NKC19-3]
MKKYTEDNTARRYIAHMTALGTTQLHLRSPSIVAWWSAAFPGFGHLFLGKYIRGFVLFVWEVVVNMNANINLAIMYSFQGNIDMVINVVDTRWLLVYLPVYFFGIWDGHRTTVEMNNVYILADREEHRFKLFSIGALEINYLDKRNPVMAVIWSLFVPGLGQLYNHRIITAFFMIIWGIVFFYLSHYLDAVVLLIMGEVRQATTVLQPEWLLMLPSIFGFAVYDSYVYAVENNKIFEKEQRQFLKDNYQHPNFQIRKEKE